jgi:hypothetical protein
MIRRNARPPIIGPTITPTSAFLDKPLLLFMDAAVEEPVGEEVVEGEVVGVSWDWDVVLCMSVPLEERVGVEVGVGVDVWLNVPLELMLLMEESQS